ncbi:hypothetical protein N657DRAFT_639984 [Parathielavia appendiculata]|uniref:Uncharacterized protein n=1 Tax=Parathielavia appendiculata TaxID=2587402 RepID=A0AAN6UBB6_9PEZI|nr:hypothetical protein N657DRAFT_639984 [Parathielavia appendiculata]
MDTSAAASTLTRQRLSVAVLSLAATATLGYFCYRVYNPPFPEPLPDRRLHRSNAIRHRRRSLPDVVHNHSREPSDASTTSVESDAHADENVDVNTVRPLNDAETVADEHEHVLEDNWYDDGHNHFGGQHQRAGQNIVSLLFRVSEDNARRNAYVHRGCLCNGCGITPIRGIRYRCANCTDFDLCETCESQGLHTKTHIFYKIRVPVPRLGSRPLQPVWYPGDPENCLRLLPKHLMARLSKETGFERPELEALWEQWTFMANTEWREDPDELGLAMDRKTFERYLVPSGGYRHIAPNLLHDRMFAFYDDNNDDLIGFSEFLHGTAYRKRKHRLRKVFKGYDIDGDGYINRRDCLRLFRAYYVVFKHMHRDILDGLDDQVMSSTEVEQLVTSRQPLSSLFGREGGFTHADADRPMRGKVTNLNTGEVHITDGATTAINEDTPDTADRQSVLTSLFTSQAHAAETLYMPGLDNARSVGERASGIEYLNGLLNPPTRISELPALLLGETRGGDDFLVVINGGGGQQEGSNGQGTRTGDGDGHRPGENGTLGSGGDGVGYGTRANGSSDSGETGPDDRAQPQAYRFTSNRRLRANARRKLFDRWKRRQFYLDEEEGVLPPDDWSDNDDILAHLNGSTDGDSKAAQPAPSSRSRSSSKVRFAEDTDDYDVRSNPSTSSRSIPERWGGMEIPDAERDVGKEIFYQVSQQAFNEILDILFKAKEDLAVQAAETKEKRDKYRHIFQSINPDEENETQTTPESGSGNPKSPRDLSLEALLAFSGYSVDQTSAAQSNARTEGEAEANRGDETGDDDDDSVPPPLITVDAQPGQPASTEAEVYRDPTMPQFRPDSVPASHERDAAQSQAQPALASSPTRFVGLQPFPPPTDSQKPTDPEAEAADGKTTGSPLPKFISRSTLINWKRLDLAEEEARERGGWGRLSYEEFERIYKSAEASGTRLDYLGTWIDFCIPST